MSITKFHDNPSSCFQDISVSQPILGLGCRVSDIATLRTWLKTGPRAHALLALFFFFSFPVLTSGLNQFRVVKGFNHDLTAQCFC